MATAAQIREHYDSLAFIYRTFWGDHIHHGLFTDSESPAEAQVKMLDHCIQSLGLRGGEEVFDVGCGHGGTLLYLAQKLRSRGTGLTLSPKQARIARENAANAGFADRLTFLVDNADTFQFPSSTADLVWVMESSEHFADKTRFFRNVKRMLRPSGQLLLAAWTGCMENARVREVARAFLCPEMWTAAQYRSAIESSGMQVKLCEDLTTQVIHTWELCQKSARLAAPAVKLLPRTAREFVEGIDIILDAYRSRDLTYTLITAATQTD
jgi:tocopherol O-methyltransferase